MVLRLWFSGLLISKPDWCVVFHQNKSYCEPNIRSGTPSPSNFLHEMEYLQHTLERIKGLRTSLLVIFVEGYSWAHGGRDPTKEVWRATCQAYEHEDPGCIRRGKQVKKGDYLKQVIKIKFKANKVVREDESEDTLLEEVLDTALLVEKYEKVLKIEGYMFARWRFPNKQKRKCYNCGSMEHFIAKCPYHKEDKKDKRKPLTLSGRPSLPSVKKFAEVILGTR